MHNKICESRGISGGREQNSGVEGGEERLYIIS